MTIFMIYSLLCFIIIEEYDIMFFVTHSEKYFLQELEHHLRE